MPQGNKKAIPLKLPPQSEEAEKSLLGAVLIDKDAVVAVADKVKSEYFYDRNHAKIFESVLELYEEKIPVDLVTVAEVLKKKKSLSKVGGRSYLAKLANSVPTAAHSIFYAEIIKNLYTKRELITAAATINEVAFDEGSTADQAIDKAEQAVFSLSQKHIKGVPVSLKEALAESFDRLDELQKLGSGLRGIPSGFGDLDSILAGMQNSNLIILAARPGIGKTAFALNLARHVAVEEKLPTCVFSLEMSQEELVDRILIRQAQIDSWKMKTAKLDEGDFNNLSEAMGVLAEAPLFIDDTPGLSVLEIRTKARRLQMESELKLIVVDYLQLIRGRQGIDNRVQEVSEISQGLKNLARELKVPVVALSQLSRGVEARGTQRPRLSDLRESGSIEQDADVVMFLYREDEENREAITCEIAKHRNGPVGEFGLFFNPKYISFFNLEGKRD